MASIFSSLFGVGQEKQQQPQAGVISQELPKQVAPYYEKLLKEAEALYKQKMEAGAPTYEGKTIAGFTPEQEQLFTGLQSLQGTQAPKFAEAEALTRGTAAKITPEEVQEYMNPYQQAVVDIEKREAQKQYESTVVPQLAAQAAATGGFGGSRQAILEGMASEAQQRLLGDIQAKGSAQAYQDAMSNIAAQRQREGAAGAQLAQLAPAGFQAQAQELGAIGKVGDVKQQQAQLALDEAYKQFLQEQQFPSEALKEYQSYVQSFPNIPTQITRTPPPAQPSLAQTLLGGLATGVGTYGAFGGFSPGGFMGMKQAETGGGIAGLPVVKAQQPTYMKDKLSRGRADFQPVLDFISQLSGKKGEEGSDLAEYQERIEELGLGKKPSPLMAKLKAKKSGLDSLVGTGEIFEPDTRKFEAKPESKTEEQIKAIIAAGADATDVGGLPENLKGKSIRVDTTPDPVSQEPMGPPMQPQGEEKLEGEPGAKIDKAGIQSQLDEQRKRVEGMQVPDAPDTKQLEALQKQLRTAEEARLTNIDKRLEDIPEERKRDLFALLAQQGAKYASTPDATLAGTVGDFTKEGRKIFKASEEEKKTLKEKKTDLNVGLMKTDIANETAKINLKTKADQKRFENIIKKENAGLALTSAELKLRDTIANEIRAQAAADTARAAVLKAGKGDARTSLTKDDRGLVVTRFKEEVSRYKKDSKALSEITAVINSKYGKGLLESEVLDLLKKADRSMKFGTKEKGTSGIAEYVAAYRDYYGKQFNQNMAVDNYIIDYIGSL